MERKVETPNANLNPARIAEIGEGNFELEVLQARQPVIVEFAAAWSRPCHILDSVLAEVAIACAGKVKVVRVNADDNPDLSLVYNIQSIPTLLYFVAGNLRAQVVGTASKDAVLARLKAVASGSETGAPTPLPQPVNKLRDSEPMTTTSSHHYSARRTRRPVNFYCDAPAAESVTLVGDFNAWDASANPMRRMPDGRWMTGVELKHGHHRYLFLVDGRPILDPIASGRARNEHNEPVSLIAVS